MMTSDDKVGGWVKKGQNHNDIILEWSLSNYQYFVAFLENLNLTRTGTGKPMNLRWAIAFFLPNFFPCSYLLCSS